MISGHHPSYDFIKRADTPYHPFPYQASYLTTHISPPTTVVSPFSSIRTARALLSSLWTLPPAMSGWTMSRSSYNDPIPKKNWLKRNFFCFSVSRSNGSIRSIREYFVYVCEPTMLLGTAVTRSLMLCCDNIPYQPTFSLIIPPLLYPST